MSFLKKAFIGTLVFVIVVVLGSIANFLIARQGVSDRKGATVTIGNARFEVEVADTYATRAQGLSGKAELGERSGMLFVFPKAGVQTFWMVGMRFPLDIIWILDDVIVGIEQKVPAPQTGGVPEIRTSPGPVDKVLEINAGVADQLGFEVGDIIEIREIIK